MKVAILIAAVLACAFCLVSGASVRARDSFSPAASIPEANGVQPSLVQFMQQHQKAYQQMQQRGGAAPADQTPENLINSLAAPTTAPTTPDSALIQHQMTTQDDGGEAFGPCKTCVFVLERIKKGTNMLLPAICSELYHKFPDAYALCHQVLNALSINGNNVRYWLFEGCFKYEIYQSKEWIKPCPSHVMCSVLKDLASNPFCPALPMEDPFKAAEGGAE